jgi:hypothetical protein
MQVMTRQFVAATSYEKMPSRTALPRRRMCAGLFAACRDSFGGYDNAAIEDPKCAFAWRGSNKSRAGRRSVEMT